MNTIEINENSLLIVLEKGELGKYLPKGEFNLSDRVSRIALRDMLASVARSKDMNRSVRLDVFGSLATEVNIFCTFGVSEKSADT